MSTLLVSFFPEYNISAAAISIFSLAFMILGSLCLVGSCTGKGKGRDYLLKPAGMFFAFAGGFGWLTKCQFPCSIPSLECKSMFTHLSPSQVSVPSSHWRWCVNQSSAWSRARTQSGSNTTTPGPSLVPAPPSSCSFSLASPSWSSPCRRCPGIRGRLAWTPSRSKWSDS